MMYICKQCNKSFHSKSKFEEHRNLRQTPCKPASHFCNLCGKGLASARSLWNHNQICKKWGETKQPEDIPTFDGGEFYGKKTLSRGTIYKMVKMMNIPMKKWDLIADEFGEK